MEVLSAAAVYKLAHYFSSRKSTEWFAEHVEIPSLNEIAEIYNELDDNPDSLYSDVSGSEDRGCYEQYKLLWSYTGGDRLVMTAVQLAVLYYMDSAYAVLYKDICGRCSNGPSLELVVKLLFDTDNAFAGYKAAAVSWKYLKYLFPEVADSDDFFHAPLILDSRILAFFHSINSIDESIASFSQYFSCNTAELGKRFISGTADDVRLSVDEIVKKAGRFSIHIAGVAKSGRRYLAKTMACDIGLDLLLIDYALLRQTNTNFRRNWKRILREVFLEPACLCLYHINHHEDNGENTDTINILREIEREYLAFGKPIFYLSDEKVKLMPFLNSEVHYYSIKSYSSSECLAMWKWFIGEYELEKVVEAERIAGVMNLPIGQVKQICEKCAEKVKNGTYSVNDEFRICYQVLDDGRYDNVRPVPEKYNWDDLKLENYQKIQLEKICNQVIFRARIMNDWGLEQNYKYGKSISAIFTGPPGTGKTMAAGVLANRLGLELYKIDLSQIVDKYIGETEKRLEEVFKRAEKSHMVLFFDEADAILGKRGEVKDAKDKYANTEVSYLLQRMEEYDGIVLMATNNRSNIDTAFIRRFRFEIPFTQPNSERRAEIWRMLLRDRIPCKNIDIEYMADTFEITGAVIKNIVLNACFDAVAEEGVLTMDILIMATVKELQKNGKVVIPADLKQYEYLLMDGKKL